MSLRNMLTKEVYTKTSAASSAYSRIYHLSDSVPQKEAPALSVTEKKQTGIVHVDSWMNKASVNTSISTDGKELTITQQVSHPQSGVYGASWEIADIHDSYSIIVPGESGQCFSKASAFGIKQFDYPMTWEAAYVLIQGERGGVIIRAVDPKYHFKLLYVQHLPGIFRLWFESRNQAPFDNLKTVVPIEWRVSAYRGNWLNGARIYNQWAEKAYHMVPIERKSAQWLPDIQFVVTMSLDQTLLAPLAKQVNPKQTMLYLPIWRTDGYDKNYPNYEPAEGFAEFVQKAHSFGFRVMPHCNYFGCDPKNPLYSRFEKYQIRDAFTKAPMWWETPTDLSIKFAYINPASKEWRELLISKMKQIVSKYGVDAIYIDQLFCIYNDGAGLVDGLNMIEGNIALMRELTEALPNIPIGGEGLDEVTCLYQSFAQRHELSIDFLAGTWNTVRLAHAHAVSSSLLSRYTVMVGYLGMPNPDNDPELYTAWRTGYECYGVIPTLPWPSLGEITQPNAMLSQIFEEARFFQKYKPKPDFESHWDARDRFVYRLADGRRAAYRDDLGSCFQVGTAGKALETLFRRIQGVSRVTIPGSIPNWPVYNAREIGGLDPTKAYMWSKQPRDVKALHIEALTAGIAVSGVGVNTEFVRVHLKNELSSIRLTDDSLKAYSGVYLADGNTRQFPGIGFSDDCGAAVALIGPAIFMHPPWKPTPNGPQAPIGKQGFGNAFVRYSLTLPKATDIKLSATVNLQPNQSGKSDGIIMIVKVESNAGVTTSNIFADTMPTPIDVNINKHAGRAATISFILTPGAEGNITCDGTVLSNPLISFDYKSDGHFNMVSPKQIKYVVAASGKPKLTRLGQQRYQIQCTMPNMISVIYDDPRQIAKTVSLFDIPYQVSQISDRGAETAPSGWSAVGIGEVTSMDVARKALSEHPPSNGKTVVDYWIRFPKRPCKLVGYTALRDGTKSTGAAFEVWVNGASVYRKQFAQNVGWQPVEVDLSKYGNQPILLSLVTDSCGPADFDWAAWGDLELRIG